MFLELSPTCPLSSSYARGRGCMECSASICEDSASKIQTVREALALELQLWLQFDFYGSLNCL